MVAVLGWEAMESVKEGRVYVSPDKKAMVSLAYSSWKGPFLRVDHWEVEEEEQRRVMDQLLRTVREYGLRRLQVLVEIEKGREKMGTAMEESGLMPMPTWITFRLEKEGTRKFLGREAKEDGKEIQMIIDEECEKESNQDVIARRATADDVKVVLRFIKELAEFEREPKEVVVTEDILAKHLDKHYNCFLLEDANDKSAIGFALFFIGYSPIPQKYLYLEDLFIDKDFRKRGAGTLAMRILAGIVLRTSCQTWEW